MINMLKLLYGPIFLFVILLCCSTSSFADDICQKNTAVGSSITDDWNPNCRSSRRFNYYDPYNPVAYYSKFYTFTLDRDADLKISLNTGFDNIFYLLAGETTSGTLLKVQSGKTFETYLPAGTYTLETTSQYNQIFTLSINYNDVGNLSCVQPIENGVAISDGWIPSCESSHRDIADPYSPYPDLGFRAKFFTFTLDQDVDLRINITSDKSSFIYLLDGHGEFAVPLASFAQAPILYSLPAGDYTIELTTQQRYAPGQFTIQLDLLQTNAQCTQDLIFNQVINDVWSGDCLIQSWANTNNDPYAGVNPERAMYYEFTVGTATDYRFNILPSDIPVVLNLYQQNDFSQTLYSTKSGSYYPTLGNQFEARLTPGVYTLEVTSHNRIALGSFSLRASVLGSSSCSSAITVPGTNEGLISAGCTSIFRQGSNNDPYGPRPGTYHAKQFEFSLAEADSVKISTSLTNTNAYIYLTNKNESNIITLIEESIVENYWNTTRTQSISKVLDAGTYVVEVTTYSPNNNSAYNLSLSYGVSTDCHIFASLGENFSGNLSSYLCPSSFKESYQIYDPYNPQSIKFGSRTLSFKADKASNYVFELGTSGFIPHVFLVAGSDLNQPLVLDQQFSSRSSRFTQYLEPGIYTLELTSAVANRSGTVFFSVSHEQVEEPAAEIPIIKFVDADYSVSEDGNKITITIQRLNNFVGEISLDYATMDDTAIAGDHYAEAFGSLVFAEGEQTKFIEIEIVDNLLDEEDKTFVFALSNLSSGVLEGSSQINISINDNDVWLPGKVKLSTWKYQIKDGKGKVELNLKRIDGTDGEISLGYDLIDGTALVDQHYEQSSGLVEFSHGESGKRLEIEIFNNNGIDGDFTFDVMFSDPVGTEIDGDEIFNIRIPQNVFVQANKREEAKTLSFGIWTLLVSGLFLLMLLPSRRNKV